MKRVEKASVAVSTKAEFYIFIFSFNIICEPKQLLVKTKTKINFDGFTNYASLIARVHIHAIF